MVVFLSCSAGACVDSGDQDAPAIEVRSPLSLLPLLSPLFPSAPVRTLSGLTEEGKRPAGGDQPGRKQDEAGVTRLAPHKQAVQV